MGKSAQELSFERVIDELKAPLLLDGRSPERAYLVLGKHDQQISLETDGEDTEQYLESLMAELWVPLGFVAYYDTPKPVIKALSWYADLREKDEKRFSHLCNVVLERLQAAAKRLTEELAENRIIQRVQ